MFGKLKKNAVYTAQITPYRGRVYAEIICNNKDSHLGLYDRKWNEWQTVLNKGFGRYFANEPREKDWVAATAWINGQLSLIEKYGTAILAKPTFIRDMDLRRDIANQKN